MADVKGTGGSVTFSPTQYMTVTEWSGTWECDAVPIPPSLAAANPMEQSAPGAIRFAGSLRALADTEHVPVLSTAHASQVATVTLTMSSGRSYSGEMLLTNISMTRRLADAEVTCDFVNRGAITTT